MRPSTTYLCSVGLCMEPATHWVFTKDAQGVTGDRVRCCDGCLKKIRERFAVREDMKGQELQAERL